MTAAIYNALKRIQGGEWCGICGREQVGRRLAKDHDHATGAWRGLLCGNCNIGLGAFDDDAERLARAIAYLAGMRMVRPTGEVTMLASGGRPPTRHKRETVELIRSLRADGLSLRQIKLRLQELQIPTATGKANWHPHSINHVLETIYPWDDTR